MDYKPSVYDPLARLPSELISATMRQALSLSPLHYEREGGREERQLINN